MSLTDKKTKKNCYMAKSVFREHNSVQLFNVLSILQTCQQTRRLPRYQV